MKHHIVLADPAWTYNDKMKFSDGERSAMSHYRTLSIDEVKTFLLDHQLEDQIADVAILFLWITNSFLLEGVGAAVCRSWGFTAKQIITWAKGSDAEKLKLQIGLGQYTRGTTEHLILATRGTATDVLKSRAVANYIETADEGFSFLAKRSQHSKKPAESYELIETMCHGPYLELFARHTREGWSSFGDQL